MVKNISSLYSGSRHISSEAEQPGYFDLIKVEDIQRKAGERAYHRRSFFKITYIEGHSKINYLTHHSEINGTALVFTNPLLPYQWEVIDSLQSGYVCVFSKDFLGKHINLKQAEFFKDPKSSVLLLNEDNGPFFKALFQRISHELASPFRYSMELIKSIWLEIIYYAYKFYGDRDTVQSRFTSDERILNKSETLLESAFNIDWQDTFGSRSPAVFPNKIGIHVNHLNKVLKRMTGKTTSELIQQKKLECAYELLRNTSMSVKEIAYQLGFQQPNDFSSFFRKKSAVTPQHYRSQKY